MGIEIVMAIIKKIKNGQDQRELLTKKIRNSNNDTNWYRLHNDKHLWTDC